MKTVNDYLLEHIHDNSTLFVFPTQVAADLWILKALEITGCESVASERFIAWDRFKEASVKSKVAGKKSISSAVRALFVHSLLAQNARECFFTTIIPPQFAHDFTPFTGWFSRLLPSLSLFKRTLLERGGVADDEDRDLQNLEERYSFFLDTYNLFEPAWQTPPFNSDGKTYVIFFPEVIEDFDEYAFLLKASAHVDLCTTNPVKEQELDVFSFQNARQELRFLAQSILRDHLEDGVQFTDIAVSVPDIEEIEPYLLRELRLHDIPFQFQAGKPLRAYAAGSLFALMQECLKNRFSLSSVKNLLSHSVFPWSFPDLNVQLVRFGSLNRCDCPADFADTWLEAFKNAPHEERLRVYYEGLRNSLEDISGAKTFSEVRTAYFTFRTRFFDMQLFTTKPEMYTAQTNAVMARCVEELNSLIQMEEEFPSLTAILSEDGSSGIFAFFTAILSQKQYLPREQGRGVHLFAYKTAACAPFERHYLINASQNAASVLISPLSFLSRDKRLKLSVTEKNSTGSFFLLYKSNSAKTLFTCADKTFTGYANPHGLLFPRAAPQEQTNDGDFYAAEQLWWGKLQTYNFPRALFSVQKSGFINRINATESVLYPQLDIQKEAAYAVIRSKITDKKERDGFFRISASDMNVYAECPLKWLYGRVFDVYDPRSAEEMVDSLKLGSFYHAVIASVLRSIKADGKPFDPAEIQTYHRLVESAAEEEAQGKKLFAALLPRLVINAALKSACRTLTDFFDFLCAVYAGCSVAEVEKKYTIPFASNAVFSGDVDCLLYMNGGWCLLDFKKNSLPQSDKYRDVPQKRLTDFQIPLYKRLFEVSAHKPDAITQAAFVSIENSGKRIASILGANPVSVRSRSLYADTQAFMPVMTAFDEAAAAYHKAVFSTELCLPSDSISFDLCVKCPFNTLCRTTYFISGENSCRLTP